MSTFKPRSTSRKPAAKAFSLGKARTPDPAGEGRINDIRNVPETRVSDRVLSALGPISIVSIGDARTQISKLVRASAAGKAYLISNARAPDLPPAVLIGLEDLNRVVPEPPGNRTLGDILASLPFSGMDIEPLQAVELPGPDLPTFILPA